MPLSLTLRSPLFAAWSPQYVKLSLPGVEPGAPLALALDGEPTAFQYTGRRDARGAEVMLELAFAEGQERTLTFTEAAESTTWLGAETLAERTAALAADAPAPEPLALAEAALTVTVPVPRLLADGAVCGPLSAVADWPCAGAIHCAAELIDWQVTCTNRGPLFVDYRLHYGFAGHRHYDLSLRCYRHRRWVEVSEDLALQWGARLVWTLNPEQRFDHVLTHRGPEFEGEPQPQLDPLGQERPGDVLCRLQMPVLSEYFVPNNRGWFAFCHGERREEGMLGVMGLYGDQWRDPVANMPEVREAGGSAQWHASLESGARHFLLTASAYEDRFTDDHRFLFHRLHAEFNQLRLDQHLDLDGRQLYDEHCWQEPGILLGDYRADAQARFAALPPLQRLADSDEGLDEQTALLLDPTPERQRAVADALLARFAKWVRQFQGWREGRHDYAKNVIGFSRALRGLLVRYELLRKDQALTEEELRRVASYAVFAARRIRDEGRWPHSRTMLHPDHPESARNFYTYGGEHQPDRLGWTNSLPNFQSDPMCALIHLACLFPEHPEADAWLRQGLDDLERQLDAYCGQSGAWVESINYALYTLSYLVITFRVLKQRRGIDYFNDERMRRYVGWLTRFFGPVDKRFGVATWPPVGNAVLPCAAGHYLLAYAGELAPDDPLREACIAVYRAQEAQVSPSEHFPLVLAAMAPVPEERAYALPAVHSENMDEVGVAMRHRVGQPDESYLFQKIGFAKDHYEQDESAFNWLAKGTPLSMDYGTYTSDIAVGAAHNLVEIPDQDNLRRGYLAQQVFSPLLDFTHCEIPVTLKLMWGRVRDFPEIDGTDGIVHREKTPYHYIGDQNPVGPKTWKMRHLLWIKPDYVALFDRVYGSVPHRWNLHVSAPAVARHGQHLHFPGDFDLDLECFVQHPAEFDFEDGEVVPKLRRPDDQDDRARKQRQHVARVYNRADGLYRTVVFARERDREVTLEALGEHGLRVVTPEYEDLLVLHNEVQQVDLPDFRGDVALAWIRRSADGKLAAAILHGDWCEAFGHRFAGRGPWTWQQGEEPQLHGGPPRPVEIAPL